MKKIIFTLILILTLSMLISINLVSATSITISTNTTYTNLQVHNPTSIDGVIFASEANQSLVSIRKNPGDNTPICFVIDDTNEAILVNSIWINNTCYTNNLPLIAGKIYRIGTGAISGTYQGIYDSTYSPAYYPGLGNFIGGCYGTNCNVYLPSSTMYAIESITLDYDPPLPPILSTIGNQTINENQTLTIQLQATEPNLNDTLTFLTNAQTTLPSASFLNSTSGRFTWTPNFNEQGFYQTTFYVTDGQFMDYETVNIQAIDVGFASISVSGTAAIGNTIYLDINDPQNANKPYILSAAFGSSPGIPLGDGRIIPLNNDWLFNAVLYVPSLFGFSSSIGTLDSQGNGQVIWAIPNLSFFQNANISFSFVTLYETFAGIQSIRSIAPAVNVTIQ